MILLSGGDQTGKTTQAVLLSASPRIGQSWMMQLNESDGDPYGAMRDSEGRPVRYKLVDHDGTWPDIMAAATQIREAAERIVAADPGGLPPLNILDSASAEWELLSNWAEKRARKSNAARKALREDANAKVEIGPTYWNPATKRHKDLMTVYRTFPGITVLTARGKWVSEIGDDGNPVRGTKLWTIEAHKSLGHQVTVHVRLSQTEPPTILGARMPQGPLGTNIVPGIDPPLVWDHRRPGRFKDIPFTLERLVFDFLGYDPAIAELRRLNLPVPGSDPDDSELAEAAGVTPIAWSYKKAIDACAGKDDLTDAWGRMKRAFETQEISKREMDWLVDTWKGRAEDIKAQQTPVLATAAAEAAQGADPDGDDFDPDKDDHDSDDESNLHTYPYPQGEQAQRDLGL